MKKNISTFVFGILLTTTTLSFSTAIKAQAIASQKTNGSAITEQVLKDILEKNRSYYQQGKVADYIPELGKADSKSIALSVIDENGKVINVGDTDKKFTIQSISKIISLMIAVREKESRISLIKWATLVQTNHSIIFQIWKLPESH